MKKIVLYFDPSARKILTEKIDDKGEKKIVLSSPYNFVYTSEIVARVIDIDNVEQVPTKLDTGYEYYNVIDFQTIRADTGIYFDEALQAFKSSEYGFVTLDGQKLRCISPLSVSKDKLKAYYAVCPTKFKRLPELKDIEEAMRNYRIVARVEHKKLEEQLGAIDPGQPRLTRIVVGQGKEPVNGYQQYFVPLINIKKKVGEIKSDGSIDFKEVGAIQDIKKGQEILKRYPTVKPVDGYDVFGDKSVADIIQKEGYIKGDNIVPSPSDDTLYVSSLDGCLDVNGKRISVLPIAYIHGDVNYDTGNIDFSGSVHITGSVLPGFMVKARGDVIIEKNVDDAHIEAQGDITVKMGVVGKEHVRLVASGKIWAKYLLNASVEATGEITVEDSIINSDVFSNDRITVVARGGKIIGGRSTALNEIKVNVSGSPNETETQLNVGRNLFIERELVEIHKEITKWRLLVEDTMRELKVSFGESVFENPKEFIEKLPNVKKKNCLILLKALSNNNKELKKLVEKSKEVQEKLKLDREPCIIIMNKAYPGTIISIKKSIKRLESPFDNVKYYEDPQEKIIRYSPAV